CLDVLVPALGEAQADAIHVIRQYLMPLAGRAANALHIPCFWEMPDCVGGWSSLGLNRLYYQHTCRRLGIHPIAISHYQAATLGRRTVEPFVLPLAVDPTVFDPRQATPIERSELGIPPNAVVFAIAARLHPDKGQDRFLRALLDVDASSDVPLHLLLLGGPVDGPFASHLRQLAEARGRADRLHLAGAVVAVDRYYLSLDVAVNSRVDAEPFGLSVIEAMAMERPVLAHALGGPTETIEDGITGWHVEGPGVRQ